MSKAIQIAEIVEAYKKKQAALVACRQQVINTPDVFNDDETVTLISLLEQPEETLLTPELRQLRVELRETLQKFMSGVDQINQVAYNNNIEINEKITANRIEFEEKLKIPEARLSSILHFELKTLNKKEVDYLIAKFKEINCFAFVRNENLVVYYDRLMGEDIKTMLHSVDYHFKKEQNHYFINIDSVNESLIPLLPDDLVYLLKVMESNS